MSDILSDSHCSIEQSREHMINTDDVDTDSNYSEELMERNEIDESGEEETTSYEPPVTIQQGHFCNICDKVFKNKFSYLKHKKSHGMGEESLSCSSCGDEFTQESILTLHKCMNKDKTFMCIYCNKALTTATALRIHTRTHTGERPYPCMFCEKRFYRRDHLKRHTRVHTGEKPYHCTECTKSFSDHGSMANHKRSHTRDKQFICEICNKGFTVKGSLSKHIKIHFNERLHVCYICDKAFARASHLKNHFGVHTRPPILSLRCPVCAKHFKEQELYDVHLKTHL